MIRGVIAAAIPHSSSAANRIFLKKSRRSGAKGLPTGRDAKSNFPQTKRIEVMTRSFSVVCSVLALLVLLLLVGPAAAREVPFKGTLEGSFTVIPVPPPRDQPATGRHWERHAAWGFHL